MNNFVNAINEKIWQHDISFFLYLLFSAVIIVVFCFIMFHLTKKFGKYTLFKMILPFSFICFAMLNIVFFFNTTQYYADSYVNNPKNYQLEKENNYQLVKDENKALYVHKEQKYSFYIQKCECDTSKPIHIENIPSSDVVFKETKDTPHVKETVYRLKLNSLLITFKSIFGLDFKGVIADNAEKHTYTLYTNHTNN